MLVGIAPSAWQIAHEVRVTPPTRPLAEPWIAEMSVPVWQPVPKQPALADAGAWALVMLPCIAAEVLATWQPPCTQPPSQAVKVLRGVGWQLPHPAAAEEAVGLPCSAWMSEAWQ